MKLAKSIQKVKFTGFFNHFHQSQEEGWAQSSGLEEKKTYIANIADIERYRDCRAKTRAGIEESMSHEASKALNDSRRCVIK